MPSVYWRNLTLTPPEGTGKVTRFDDALLCSRLF